MRIICTSILFVMALLTYSQTDTSKSNIYIFRATGFTGSARQFKIFLDGSLTCKINNDKYLILEISSGKHSFAIQMDGQSLKESTDKVEILTEAGKSYYLSVVLVTGGIWSSPHFDELTENSAKTKIKNLEKINCDR